MKTKKLSDKKIIEDLIEAASRVYDDANDRGETHGDDGKEYDDFKLLRLAIEQAEAR